MLNRRLQVLVDEDRWRRLERRARERGTSVGRIVREAIDAYLPSGEERRREAIRAILAAEPMPVPADPADLRRELDDIGGGGL